MKVIDLFSGAGGLSEGFRRSGFDIISHVEIDSAACETLRIREIYYFLKEQNKLHIYYKYVSGEITKEELFEAVPEQILLKVIEMGISSESFNFITEKINANYDGEIDGIIGGPPCQAYSIAGRSRDKNGMKNDPRNYLYIEYVEYLNYYNPKFFLFENVPGIYSAGNGKILEDIIRRIENAGYHMELKELNSKNFGVCENRRRVIIIGWRKDIEMKYPNFENESPINIAELLSDLPKIKAGDSILYANNPNHKNHKKLKEMKIINKGDNKVIQHIARPHNERDLEIYNIVAREYKNTKSRVKYNQLPKDLITHKNKSSFLDRYKVVPYDSICHTVVAHISKDGHHYIHYDETQNRSITVREAARIQSFPDDYYFETSRTSAFRQIGNAVPPLMAEKIAIKIKEELEG